MFPFSAIVGQPLLKRALLLCAVDPRIGGLLISGDKGTAKSTSVRAFARLLPEISRVQGCRFNCDPSEPATECIDCANNDSPRAQLSPTPLVELPLGATEDRVVGSLDFERALQSGKRQFQTGILAAAHRGFLYIDEVNLLPDRLIDVLLDAAASGVNVVERESMTLQHRANFVLVGSMNPEEGELRPQFLDRFAMKVNVLASSDPLERAEVVRLRLDYERRPDSFADRWYQAEKDLSASVLRAREALPQVQMSDDRLQAISALCAELGVRSLRADIFMNRVACALAALDNKADVSEAHIREAAELVLPHRLPQQGNTSGKQPDMQDAMDKHLGNDQQTNNDTSSADSEQPDETEHHNGGNSEPFSVVPPAALSTVAKIEIGNSKHKSSARRNADRDAVGIGSRNALSSAGSIAVTETIMNAVTRTAGRLEVTKQDIQRHQLSGKSGTLIILAVDASGSLAAVERMRLVKGTALALLADAYQRRDKVCVISFSGDSAELLLPPTRSSMQASQFLSELPTGGTTPLSAGLLKALEIAEGSAANEMQPLVVLLTDGRANKAMETTADPWDESLHIADKLSAKKIPSLVLDCESGQVRLGRAGALAERLNAQCLPLEDITAGELKKIVIQAAGVGV